MEPLQQSPDEPELDRSTYARRRRRRWPGVVLGLGVAVLAAAGLTYWVTAGDEAILSAVRPILSEVRPAPRPSGTRGYAPPRPDAGQVARAYGQLREIYAERGAPGVVSFARSCAESLATDPRVLDFCVAFDIYAVSLTGDDEDAVAWRVGADERDLALARIALPPAEDPAARLAEIRELALKASLLGLEVGAPAPPNPMQAAQPAAPAAAPAPSRVASAPSRPPAARPQAARARSSTRVASAKSTKSAKSQSASTRTASASAASPRSEAEATCLRQAAAARHTVCASPTLREADRRLRQAYSQALDAGVDASRLANDQVLFSGAANAAAPDRDAVETLFNQRTQELEALTEAR